MGSSIPEVLAMCSVYQFNEGPLKMRQRQEMARLARVHIMDHRQSESRLLSLCPLSPSVPNPRGIPVSTIELQEPVCESLCVCMCMPVCTHVGSHVCPCSTYTLTVTCFVSEYTNPSHFEWNEHSPFAHLANPSPCVLCPKELQGAWSLNSAAGKVLLCNTELHNICLNSEDILDMLSNDQILFMLPGRTRVWIILTTPVLAGPFNFLDFNIWANFDPYTA